MWKLIGSRGLCRRRPQRLPGGVGDAELERADDGTAVAELGDALELSDRRLGRVGRQHRQHAEPARGRAR